MEQPPYYHRRRNGDAALQGEGAAAKGSGAVREEPDIPPCAAVGEKDGKVRTETGEPKLPLIGEHPEFRKRYHRICRDLRQFLRQQFSHLSEAERWDIIQEAWLRILQHPKQWESEQHLFNSLRVTARHLAIDDFRKQRHSAEERGEYAVVIEDAEHQIALRFYLEEIRTMVEQRFGPEGWLLLWLCATGWTLQEISEGAVPINGTAPPEVYQKLRKSVSQLSRFRKQMLEYLRQHCPPPWKL